eukprot:12261032-Prorocentrum_lima.AAC.1
MMRPTAGVGLDGIVVPLLQLLADDGAALDAVGRIFYHYANGGVARPRGWEIARSVLTPKVPVVMDPLDLRPITVLSASEK